MQYSSFPLALYFTYVMGFLSLDSWGKVLIASAAFMTLASHLCLEVSVSTLFS